MLKRNLDPYSHQLIPDALLKSAWSLSSSSQISQSYEHVQKAHDLRPSILIALVSYFSASKGECKNCVFEPFSPQVYVVEFRMTGVKMGWWVPRGVISEQFCPTIFADGVIPTLFALLGDTHSVSKLFSCGSSS